MAAIGITRGVEREMASAFENGKDGKAEALARQLTRPEFGNWPQCEQARELLQQLPARRDERRRLSLPSPSEWSTLSAGMSRPQRIEYLIERLRLMHASFHPGYMRRGHAHAYGTVVDPLVELENMQLEPAEVGALLPMIASSDFLRVMEWPAEPPLFRLSWTACSLFQRAAGEPIIDSRWLLFCTAGRQRAAAELRAWWQTWGGVDTATRLARQLIENGTLERWPGWFWSLYEIDPHRAVDTIVAAAKRWPHHAPQVARLLVLLDRRERITEVRQWLDPNDREQRFLADVLTLAAGEDRDGKSLQTVLADLVDADTETVHVAVPALIACDRPEAKAFLLRCLEGKGPAEFRSTFGFAARLLRARHTEAFEVLTTRIDLDALGEGLFDKLEWVQSVWERPDDRTEPIDLPWGEWRDTREPWIRRR